MFGRTGRDLAVLTGTVLGLVAMNAAPAVAAPAAGCAANAKTDFARVQLYKDPNCKGASVIVPKTGDGNRANFAAFRNFDGTLRQVDNNRSSLSIDKGTCVRFFDLKNYGGQASTNICAPNGVVFWNLDRFDDRGTSMRVCPVTAQAQCNAPGAAAPAPAPAPGPAPAPSGNTIQDKAVAWGISKDGTKECQGEQPAWVRASGFGPCSTNWCGIFVRQAYRAAGVELGPIAYTENIYNSIKAGRNRLREVSFAQVRKGDLIMMYTYPKKGRRVTHVGIARGPVVDGAIPTVEGNTSGDRVAQRMRSLTATVGGKRLVQLAGRVT